MPSYAETPQAIYMMIRFYICFFVVYISLFILGIILDVINKKGKNNGLDKN